MPKLKCRVSGYIPNRGNTVCQRPMQKLIPFEITADNRELSNNKLVNDSKGADETYTLNSRRFASKGQRRRAILTRVTR